MFDKEYYNIRQHKCNLSSQTGILEFLDNYDSDLLVILRGGGSGLDVFNEIALCKRVIELPIPFITSIGHISNKTLLQRVSDKAFSTPTSVGVFLQKVVNVYKERLRLFEEKVFEMNQFRKQSDNEKQLLNNQIATQKKFQNKMWMIFVLFTLIVLFLLKQQLS